MRPTGGQIVAHGRVFGLLELAAGFHPELSGRDNVFLNGAFLGLSRREMAAASIRSWRSPSWSSSSTPR